MTEKQWQSNVVKLAKLHGWLVYHTFDSRRSTAGFPDLVLVKGKRLIFAELKTDHGRIRPEQAEWMNALMETGAKVYLWRPGDVKEVTATLAVRMPDLIRVASTREPKPQYPDSRSADAKERKARRDELLRLAQK